MRFSKIEALFGVLAVVVVGGLVISLGNFPVEVPPRVTGVVVGCNPVTCRPILGPAES